MSLKDDGDRHVSQIDGGRHENIKVFNIKIKVLRSLSKKIVVNQSFNWFVTKMVFINF